MMKVRPFIVQSLPRSGSTWLGELINTSPDVIYRFQPVHAWSFPWTLSEASTSADFRIFFDRLLSTQDPFVTGQIGQSTDTVRHIRKSATPGAIGFKEVHAYQVALRGLQVLNDLKCIFLIRNPIKVTESWVSNPREFDPSWTVENEWWAAPSKNGEHPTNRFGVEEWIKSTLLFEQAAKSHPKRVRLLRYEDLVRDPIVEVESIYRFLNVRSTPDLVTFVHETKAGVSPDPYSIRRGGLRRLNTSLSPAITKTITRILESLGLDRYLAP